MCICIPYAAYDNAVLYDQDHNHDHDVDDVVVDDDHECDDVDHDHEDDDHDHQDMNSMNLGKVFQRIYKFKLFRMFIYII